MKEISASSYLKRMIIAFVLVLLFIYPSLAQNSGVLIDPSETLTRHQSATLEVGPLQSTTANDYGGFLAPRMTLANRGNIASPAAGLLIYQTDNTPGYYYFNGSTWTRLFEGAVGSGATNYLARWTSAIALGTGATYDNGTNVGIGTTSPGQKLDVNGDINLGGDADLRMSGVPVVFGSSTDVYANMRVIRNTSTALQDGMYIGYGSTGGTAADIRFYANGTTERMKIQASDGNVGIGTGSPAQKLDVNGAIRSTGHHFIYNSSPTINFNDSDEPDYYLHANSNRLYVLHGDGDNAWNGNRPLTVYQGDKVGINEISPSWRLQVNGANTPSFLAQQNGTHSYGIVAGLETFNNGSATQDGPRLGFHKHGAKVWSMGIQAGGLNGFAIWEDGYNWAWGSDAKFIIPPGGGLNKVIISAGGSFMQDWPGGWGGGLSSWDMCVASIRLSGTSNRSDVRLKKDIESLGDIAVSTIMELRPVSYHWIDEKLPQRKIYGFVAQEVQNVLPEIIEEGADDMKTLGMSYTDLIPILTKATQEQQHQINEQRQEIEELKILVEQLLKKNR